MAKLKRYNFQTAIAALAVFSALHVPLRAAAQDNRRFEYQIKAAFLGRFLGFIEREEDTAPIAGVEDLPEICTLGDPNITRALGELARVPAPGRGPHHFREITDLQDSASCAILFLGQASGVPPESLRDLQPHYRAVTVSDTPGFAEKGGMIELIKEGAHIRFIINRQSAKRIHIRFSPQLLSLAQRVID